MTRTPPGERTQEVVMLYNRIGDTVMTALKTLAAHSHIGIMTDKKDDPGNPDLLSLKRFLCFTRLLFPSCNKIEDGEFAYVDPEEDVTADSLQVRTLKNKEIPALMKKYSDFPEACAALETIQNLLPHLDRWKQAVREYVPADCLAETWLELMDLTCNQEMDSVIPHSKILDNESARRTRDFMELSADVRLEADEFALFVPSGPAL